MQPISQTNQTEAVMDADGHATLQVGTNGKKATIAVDKQKQEAQSREQILRSEEKVTLPVEMASMVPLRSLLGKMVRKAHADLMTLTDTLPAMSNVEKKRQILNYATFMRKQFLKLHVLVKWAENADDIQMCQNIMSYLANQNQIFHDTTHYLHKIHSDLPAARIRNFDILSAVDVLMTGTYQRLPLKYKNMLPPAHLTDEEVLETFRQMNDVIRMRMTTSEVLPSPMEGYRIESGRISFSIENEFNVALTLMGPPSNQRWWIVSLDILVKSTAERRPDDVDISLNDTQLQNIRIFAQQQLVPPQLAPAANLPNGQPANEASTAAPGEPQRTDGKHGPLFFPLINLYDYLHQFCLNMQLEVLYMQAVMLSKMRWLDQLKVQMDQTRTKLTLLYWEGGTAAAHWAHPQSDILGEPQKESQNSTTLEICINNKNEKHEGPFSQSTNLAIAVRDELKGLVQKAGLGASVLLADLDETEKVKVYTALKYPKVAIDILWGGVNNLHSEKDLMKPSDLNVERLLWHVTHHHALCIMNKFREVLKTKESFLEENGIYLAKGRLEDILAGDDPSLVSIASKELKKNTNDGDLPSLIIQYRHRRFIAITLDMRTGRAKVREAGYRLGEGDVKLRELEERLNNDPSGIAKHLLWLRSEVVIREIISLAKQLNLHPYHPSQMNLRADDIVKLFGDLPTNAALLGQTGGQSATHPPTQPQPQPQSQPQPQQMIPSHCVFLQFAQFSDWYFVLAIVRNEIHSWLCCINKTYDQVGLYQLITDLTNVSYDQMWKEQFLGQRAESDANTTGLAKKRGLEDSDDSERKRSNCVSDDGSKLTLKKSSTDETKEGESQELLDGDHKIDNLSIDLRFLAKLDSLCRAYITNRKVELQLLRLKSTIRYRMRPLLKSMPVMEAQVANHPAADRMEVICVPQQDLVKACAYQNAEDGGSVTHPGLLRDLQNKMQPRIGSIVQRMKNDLVMRSSGWWACGRSECFVVIQDRFDWKNIPLECNGISDHISLDKATNVLSFTYTEIDTCVERFLSDWERILMMTNLARQVSSTHLEVFKDQLKFEAFNLQELKFIYAKDFTCCIRWESLGKGRLRQYIVEVGTKNKSGDAHETTALPLSLVRNPHWRVAGFLQDILNEKQDLVYFIKVLFQTLPLMTCLENIEADRTQRGDVGEVSIIPRAVDSVRIVYSSMHALDLRFTDPDTICVSDAAFHHLFYTSPDRHGDASTFTVPEPYIVASTPASQGGQQTDAQPGTVKAVKVAQQLTFSPFTQFDTLIESAESWIFKEVEEQASEESANGDLPWYALGHTWASEAEPKAIPFKHGIICSASLCRGVLLQLQHLV